MNKFDLSTTKFAILSDIHWGISNNSDIKNDILVKYIDWYIDLLKKHKINTVLFLGDWFDSRTTLSVKTINVVLQICKKFEKNKIKMFLIVGNHDIYYKDTLEINSLNIFNEFKNITVLKEPAHLRNEKVDKSLYLFPWNTFSTEYGKCDLMLGHFNFQGAKMVGTVNTTGETIETLLKVAPQIFSGHFHLRNTYTRKGGELITVGNPVQQTWGDFDNQKGVYIYDLKTMSYEFIENDISPTYQRIYFSKFKKKLEDLKNVRGNFVEFVVDEKVKIEVIMKIKKAIESSRPITHCLVDYVFNKKKLELKDMKFDENSDILNMSKYEYMIKYINENEKELKELGIKLSTLQTMLKEYYEQSQDSTSQSSIGVSGNKIIFNSLDVQNFLSVGDEIHIDFSEYMGMNYIFGKNKDTDRKNGSGKSTIFCDAILWGLFDTTVKKLKRGSLPHRLRGKNCHVKINFTVGKRNFTVINSIKPTEYTLIENLDTEDKDLTKSSKAETLKYISEELLNSSYLMFRNCLILAITNNTNIFEMNKSEKREFLETMMDYAVIGNMFEVSKKDRNKVDRELTLKRQDSMRIEDVLTDFTTKQKDFDKNKKLKLEEIQSEIDLLRRNMDNLDTDLGDCPEKLEKLKEVKQKIVESIDKLNEAKTNTLSKITVYKSEIDNFNAVQKKYSKVLDVICEKCEGTVNDILGIADVKKTLEDKEEKINELKEKVVQISDKIMTIKSDKQKKVVDSIDKMEEKIYKTEKNIEKKRGLEASITIKEKQWDDEKNRKSDFESLIEKNQKELDAIRVNISKLTEQKMYLDYIVFLTSEDGIRKNLLTEYITLLNGRIRSYLDEMGCEYTLILDNEFNYTFLTTSGECEYESFSAGERVALISACMFAFRDLLFGQGTLQSNLFICDEILDTSLDDILLNNIIKLLKKVSEEQNVFVISHRECVTPDDFNNVIKIEKENEYTRIVENEE
jgi:DNA repair exonuclease SbcCD ATPase subunit